MHYFAVFCQTECIILLFFTKQNALFCCFPPNRMHYFANRIVWLQINLYYYCAYISANGVVHSRFFVKLLNFIANQNSCAF